MQTVAHRTHVTSLELSAWHVYFQAHPDDLPLPGVFTILPWHPPLLMHILSNYPYSMALFSTKPYTVAAKKGKLTIGKIVLAYPNQAFLMHNECEQAITYHAMSRVKDHMGIENSFVFAFGIKPEQLEEIISWGPGRSEQCEEFLARGKRNNLIDDGSASVAEYFRTGHDVDILNSSNLQVVEETNIQDPAICIESIEGKGVCKNQRNEKKPFLWSTAEDKFLAKPQVYCLSKVESMLYGYNKVVGKSNFLKKSFTDSMDIPTKLGSRIVYERDSKEVSKLILEENGTNISEVINTSKAILGYLPKDNINNYINDTMQPYIPDYPFKTKAQRAFFKNEAKTFFVKITNKLDLVRELCYRDNAYALQKNDGNGYRKVDENITDELLQDHPVFKENR